MDWKLGPPILVGEKALWMRNGKEQCLSGIIKWIGHIPELDSDWSVGMELDQPLIDGGCDGFWQTRKLFECKTKHGIVVPVNQIQKFTTKSSFRESGFENHSKLELASSKKSLLKKIEHLEANINDQHAGLDSKSSERAFESKLFERRNNLGENSKNRKGEKNEKYIDHLGQRYNLKSKIQNNKSSLKKKRIKRKSLHEHEYKFDANRNFEDDLQLVKKSLDACSYFTFDQVLETQKKFNTKKLSANTKNMEGYFKEIKEGESAHGGHKKPVNECEKQLDELVAIHLQESGASSHQKEKKFFSFLKWFKKNKENSNLKNVKESSGASSPMFERKRSSSCESIDTLFSTQTVRSFAYIPTTQYEPSAPPYSLLDDFKGLENSFGDPSSEKSKLENVEPCYEKKKKRKAPGPPRLTRENSLPTTLEHRKNDNELNLNDVKTYHRRTVSESFKDKKAGAYCHVQGKRKAPLPPPTVTLYPNLQKLNNPCQSLHKKKKPAPLPPEPKPECESPKPELAKRNSPKNPTENSKDDLKVSKPLKRDAKQKDENIASEEQKLKIEENKNNQSLSPLPSRPWYKRSHRESGGSNFIRKELLKNFEKKKNKEVEDWMPEVGFSRKSFSTENSHSKFNIFSRLEKHEDKRKEEKRKSQISILTNISELDKEAAEIVKKEQAEEKKMMAANDAKYYSPNSFPNSSNVFQRICKNESEGVNSNNVSSKLVKPEEIKEESDKVTQRDLKRTAENNESKRSERDAEIISENVTSNLTETNTVQAKKSEINISDSVREVTDNTKINYSADASNSTTQDALSKAQNSNLAINLNRFDVTNKEVYYLNEPWVCPKCTLENPGWRVFCEICSSVKPRFLYNSNGNLNGNQTQLCTNATPKSISEKSDRPKNLEPKRTSPPTEEVHDSEKESEKNETGENVKEQKKVQSNNNASVDYNDKMQPQEKQEQNALLKPETSMSTKSDESISGPRNRPNKLDLSSHVKEIPNESQKYGAVKKTQVSPPKQNKEKVVEAYLITKTTVLEDIIIKRADQNSKVSTSAQTNSTAAPRDAGNKIRPPPRKKVTDANAGGITSKEVRVKEIQNSSNHREPIDLSLTAEDVSKENLKRYGKDLEELTKKLIRADGLADFKAKIKTMAPDTEMNTVAVKKLLKKLETAINDGDHLAASGLAKELALLKINCSVTRQMADNRMSTNCSKITVDMYVEDKVSHEGPIQIQLSPTMTLLQLKKKVEQELGIPTNVQRWILGKQLAADDSKCLESAGLNNNSSIFLYLVAPDNKVSEDIAQVYSEVKPCLQESSERTNPEYKAYNDDRFSHCEGSENGLENDLNDSLSNAQENLNSSDDREKKTTVLTHPSCSDLTKNSDSKEANKKVEKHFLFSQKSQDAENDVVKELKLISANSVRQKVEQLNKTFAENNRQEKSNLKASESWKCITCTYVNSRSRLTCFACNAKKLPLKPKPDEPGIQKEEPKKSLNKKEELAGASGNDFHYKELVELQDSDLVPNIEPFHCPVCMTDCSLGEGVILKDCLHTFCRTCLINTIQYSEDAEVKCPYLDETYSCKSVLQQREIKALVPEKIFECHLARSVKEAENKIGNAFHCKTPDCKGWCIYEDNVNEFYCPVCKFINCLTCHAIHTGINCKQFQEKMKDASETDADAKKTRIMLEEMVEKGEALVCPKCQVVLMKKWGCDWLRCSMCKTEICWVTRGFRWGPAGKGDTSGGCRCGINGVKCHPKCNYCH